SPSPSSPPPLRVAAAGVGERVTRLDDRRAPKAQYGARRRAVAASQLWPRARLRT
uniref:Uncharacterized protein n=2 Tax=Emiliania huxleyi TaxID=2903 RepID=A0A0D3ICF2_EMIH1